MSGILRWSRCALAILLAIQAYPSASLAQERSAGNAKQASQRPVRMAQYPEPEATSGVRMGGQGRNVEMSPPSSWISDSGCDTGGYCDQGSEYCGGDYSGGCNDGCTPQCYSGSCDSCSKCGPRCCFYADELYLQVTGADVAHAEQGDFGNTGVGGAPMGQVGTLDFDFDSGYRLGGAISCS